MKVLLPLVMLSAVLASGCDNQSAATSTATAPTAPTITEPAFTGTLSVGGTKVHTFNVTQVGTLSVTLTAAGPPAAVAIGLVVGTPTFTTTGTLCTPITQTFSVQASTAPQVSGTVSTTGAYCLAVFDIGNLTNDITYSVTVTHT